MERIAGLRATAPANESRRSTREKTWDLRNESPAERVFRRPGPESGLRGKLIQEHLSCGADRGLHRLTNFQFGCTYTETIQRVRMEEPRAAACRARSRLCAARLRMAAIRSSANRFTGCGATTSSGSGSARVTTCLGGTRQIRMRVTTVANGGRGEHRTGVLVRQKE